MPPRARFAVGEGFTVGLGVDVGVALGDSDGRADASPGVFFEPPPTVSTQVKAAMRAITTPITATAWRLRCCHRCTPLKRPIALEVTTL